MLRHVFTTVATALVAMSIAIWLKLPMPQITMVSVFILMQPLTRQVLAKSLYRMIGTVTGVAAVWLLAPLFAQTPESLLMALGVWVTLFTAAAAFNRDLRAYSIVLTGYTPLLIGIPAAMELHHVRVDALSRLAEVGLGVACAAIAALALGRRAVMPVPPHAPPASPDPAPAMMLPAGTRTVQASLAGLHPAIAMLAMGTLWLATSWRGGAMATLNATVDCALVALAAHPVRAALQMSSGTVGAVAMALLLKACYLWLPLPPSLLLAPALAIGAWMTGRAQTLGQGLGYCITLSMLAYPGAAHNDQYLYDSAGLVLSVAVLTAVCAVLWPLRQRVNPI